MPRNRPPYHPKHYTLSPPLSTLSQPMALWRFEPHSIRLLSVPSRWVSRLISWFSALALKHGSFRERQSCRYERRKGGEGQPQGEAIMHDFSIEAGGRPRAELHGEGKGDQGLLECGEGDRQQWA